jgi:hypothetical protein
MLYINQKVKETITKLAKFVLFVATTGTVNPWRSLAPWGSAKEHFQTKPDPFVVFIYLPICLSTGNF